jgi:arsenite transporter
LNQEALLLAREVMEEYQVFIYLMAICLGLLVGVWMPDLGGRLEWILWPLLGSLLYATFTQVPLVRLRDAFTAPRYMFAAVIGNFLLLPCIVWGLMALGPAIPAVQLGLLLVLLVPCTDWFITFTHLGGGDTRSAIAFTPISLLLQLLLLPFYVWLFLGTEITASVAQQELILAFVGLIVAPLIAAYLTETWVARSKNRQSVVIALGWLPVPLLALVVFCIAAAQVNLVLASVGILPWLLLLFAAFLLAAGMLSVVVARVARLPVKQGRVLAFSFGSRNSFVVLPLALSLPASYELAVVVVVFQSLVELFGMAFFLWWVPKKLHR